MPTLRGWWFGLALALFSSMPAHAGDVVVDKHTATRAELLATVTRYGSLPGGGKILTHARHVNLDEAHAVVDRYGSLPGGVVLEGSAPGVGTVSSVSYDAATGSLKVDGKLTYKPNLSPVVIAQLARAIAADDRIGISITDDDVIAYGDVSIESMLARDLAVADTFLADLVLPPREWTAGYRTADAYEPKSADSEDDFVVLFRFQDFDFSVADDKLTPTNVKLDIVVVPVAEEKAADGGYLIDNEAIAAGTQSAAIEANADHVSQHFAYYLKERATSRALELGQTAALLRHLKAYNVDLTALATEIEKTSQQPEAPAWTSLDEAWKAYLDEIKAANDYANWTNLRTTALPEAAPAQ